MEEETPIKREQESFKYLRTYSYEEIYEVATPVILHGAYLIADTPGKQYWFVRDGHFWRLDHSEEYK